MELSDIHYGIFLRKQHVRISSLFLQLQSLTMSGTEVKENCTTNGKYIKDEFITNSAEY